MTEHRASCQCGALHLVAAAEPEFVLACNCRACQKRTGSPFGAGQYFRKQATTVGGAHKTWTRRTDSGLSLTNHFCPECGTNLFWTMDLRPDHVGVALGAFDTPKPAPTRVVWMSEKLDWVEFPAHCEFFDKGSVQPAK